MTAGASIFGTAWAWGIGINRKHAAPVRPKLPFYLTRPYALPPLPPRGGGVGGVCRGRDEPETAAATTRSLATTTTITSTLTDLTCEEHVEYRHQQKQTSPMEYGLN